MRLTLEHGYDDEHDIEASRVSLWLGETRVDVYVTPTRNGEAVEIYSPEAFVVVPVASNVVQARPIPRQ